MKFGKQVIPGCLAALMITFGAAIIVGFCTNNLKWNDRNVCQEWQYISRYISYSPSEGKVENSQTGETINNVDWIIKSVDGDSMVCFASNDKRGYFNKFTGKVVIKPQYQRAWIFSEGLACVEENDKLYFINHQNKKVFKANFSFDENADGYVFHDGFCIVAVDHYKYGIIDKQGAWLLKPMYEDVKYCQDNLWIVEQNKKFGVFDATNKKMLIPIEYRYISRDRQGFVVQYQDYSMKRLNPELTIKDNFVFSDVSTLSYSTGHLDKNGDDITQSCKCLSYKTGSWTVKDTEKVGLMSPDGKPLTQPIYDDISGLGPDLYLAQIDGFQMVINGKGEKVM